MLGESADRDYKVKGSGEYSLNYHLSERQEAISKALIENFYNHKNTLVYAVTGAGKTEIVFNVISLLIHKKLSVGFAAPRKDVIIDLYDRFRSVFKDAKVIAVYGDNTTEKYGDLICLTTHQLYRYENHFDLLIMDEIDAFPYQNNELLEKMFQRAIKGNYILMSATPTPEYIEKFKSDGGEVLELLRRYHGHDLPVPKIKVGFGITKLFYLYKSVKKFVNEKKPVLIFVPNIDDTESLYLFLSIFFKKGEYVSSKRENRVGIVENFKKEKYDFLVTTSILERGVTIKNLQVIIYNADSNIYTAEALVQISGRVGRKTDYPSGEIIYIASKKTKSMIDSIKRIEDANRSSK